MKTLAVLKMEKNFVGHIEKGYPRRPYEVYSIEQLAKRLADEGLELVQALTNKDLEQAKLECADVSNLVDFLFEKLAEMEP